MLLMEHSKGRGGLGGERRENSTRGKAELCVMCQVVLWGGLMILAPHIVLYALRTVTYARGAGKVGFSRTDRLHWL